MRRGGHQPDPGKRRDAGDLRSPVKNKKAEQGEHGSERGQHDIFPRGLERFGRILEADQEGRQKRGQLDRDPHQCDVGQHRHRQHRQNEEIVKAVVMALLGFAGMGNPPADIAPRVERRSQRDERHQQQDERAQPVAAQRSARDLHPAFRDGLNPHMHDKSEHGRRRDQRDWRGEPTASRRQR